MMIRRTLAAFMVLGMTGGFAAGSDPVSAILTRAYSLIGTPYRTGGMAPGGFDCSGFIAYLYRPALPSLPRVSRDMARSGEAVAPGDWRAGDLLFYATGPDPSIINHAALWYGEGRIIHSISDGPETGVVITPADSRYWSRRYVSARRVLPSKTPAQASRGAPQVPDTPSRDTPKAPPRPEDSPWDSFEGFLRGDFESWKKAEDDAFREFLEQNG